MTLISVSVSWNLGDFIFVNVEQELTDVCFVYFADSEPWRIVYSVECMARLDLRLQLRQV